MKKLLMISGGLIVLLIVLALALPLFVDVNHFKPTLETDLSKALGRQVQIGNIELAIFSGGVTIDDVAIADDPAFSHTSFVTAKQITVGVSLLPLIFSRRLEVRSFKLVEPEVTLLRSPSGTWNYSSLGGATLANSAGKSAAKPASGGIPAAATAFSVDSLSISNGKISIGTAAGAHGRPQSYTNVNLNATNLSTTTQFPFHLLADVPGGGQIRVDGKAGPIDAADASLTPLTAKVDIDHFDLATTGFVEPASGIAGAIAFHGNVASDGRSANSQGTMEADNIKLVAAGQRAGVPINIEYSVDYDLKRQEGTLKQGAVRIGKATANLSGSFDASGAETSLRMKINGQAMPVPDLEGVLPAVGVILPPGASLTAGTLDATLAITGPVNKLTIMGPIHLSNGKLAGFNLKSKLGALGPFASLGGIPGGSDTEIQTLSADVHQDPSGTKAENLQIVVPSIGAITGDANVNSTGQLDCKMTAKLSASGALGAMSSTFSTITAGGKSQKNNGIPFKIQGTTSNPVFIPDVERMAGSMAKDAASTPVNAATAAGSALGSLLGKKKKPQQ